VAVFHYPALPMKGYYSLKIQNICLSVVKEGKMLKTQRILTVFLILSLLFPTITSKAQSQLPENCETIAQPNGSIYAVCMPESDWNGDLIIFAHGYVAFNEPVGIPMDQMEVDGTSIPGMVNELGYAFATTSYPINGLAVIEGIQDIRDLNQYFANNYAIPNQVYLAGASEGGLITALIIEQYPQEFSGGLSLCGPIGDFQEQIDYYGDFRVLFDYFFPDVLPPEVISIPEEVIAHWDIPDGTGLSYTDRILEALSSNPQALGELLRVSRITVDPNDKEMVETAVLRLLWYNVFATNDAREKLNGQPFSNRQTLYIGSSNDFLLNTSVQRFRADLSAINTINNSYQTSGSLRIPLVTMHNLGDWLVPYWHEFGYLTKVTRSNSQNLYTNLPVFSYGHCEFTADEVLIGFSLLRLKTEGLPIDGIPTSLP
jgi:pimeloyl-ACP methyl ester carboxylesterase